MAIASILAGAAFHLSAMVSSSASICRRLDKMLSNLDAEWATIILCEESSRLWCDLHNVR